METVTGSKNEHYELQMEHGERNFNIMQKCQLNKWSENELFLLIFMPNNTFLCTIN